MAPASTICRSVVALVALAATLTAGAQDVVLVRVVSDDRRAPEPSAPPLHVEFEVENVGPDTVYVDSFPLGVGLVERQTASAGGEPVWEAASWAEEPSPWGDESDGAYAEPWARDLGWGLEPGLAARAYTMDVAWTTTVAPGERRRWHVWLRTPGVYRFAAHFVRARTWREAARAPASAWETAYSPEFVVRD